MAAGNTKAPPPAKSQTTGNTGTTHSPDRSIVPRFSVVVRGRARGGMDADLASLSLQAKDHERDHASALRALARVMPKWYATTDDDTRRRFLDCRTGDALAYAVEVGLAGYVADTRRLSARGPGFEFEDDFDELDDARTPYARCLTHEEVLAAYRAVAPDTGNVGAADAVDACDTDTDNERRIGS